MKTFDGTRWNQNTNDVVNVKDFGAVGDGVTNDTSAIQSAINHVTGLGGGEVFVPYSPTPYRIGRLFAKDNLTFRSETGVVFKRKGYIFGIINITTPPEGSTVTLKDPLDPYSGVSNVSIIGGTWDCAVDTEPFVPGGLDLFYFGYCRNIKFKDITVLDVITNHALDINAVENLRVSNSNFFGYLDGTVEQNRFAVEAIQLSMGSESNVRGVETAQGAPCTDVIIEGCVFGDSDAELSGPWPTGVGNHSSNAPIDGGKLNNNLIVRNNTFIDSTLSAIAPYTWDQMKIIDNNFFNCVTGIQAGVFTTGVKWDRAQGAWVPAPTRVECGNQIYSGNYFEDCKIAINARGAAQSSVDGAWAPMVNMTVVNNTIKSKNSSSTYGIRLSICKNSIVSNNIVEGHATPLSIESCQDVNVVGNAVRKSKSFSLFISNSGTPTGSVFSSQGISIKNNSIIDAHSHGISVTDTNSLWIVGNYIKNPSRGVASAGITLFGTVANGVFSSNTFEFTSTPYSSAGIRFDYLGTADNISVLKDNAIFGVSSKISGLPKTGIVYGPIDYSV